MSSRGEQLREIAWVFLRLGTISFGGPAAHIAMMREELVERRKWVGEQQFLDLLSAANLIPGPNSTELAIHLGQERAGGLGLVVAGVCFILPAALIVAGIGALYVTYGSLPEVESVLYGIKPAIIAIVLHALYSLARTAIKSRGLLALAVVALAAALLGRHELLILFVSGMIWAASRQMLKEKALSLSVMPIGAILFVPPMAVSGFSLTSLFLFFVKVGSVLFGSGYVLLAFLKADLVERWHWLTEAQLLDAIAVGQVTPGPVFTTATFIGYVLGGGVGAAVATAGIFLPAFVFVAMSQPLVPRMRRSATVGAFLDGVNVASLALMAAVTLQLVRSAVVDGVTLIIAAASIAAVFWYRLNSAWLVLASALAGLSVKWLL